MQADRTEWGKFAVTTHWQMQFANAGRRRESEKRFFVYTLVT